MNSRPLKSLYDISLAPKPGDEAIVHDGSVRIVIMGVSPERVVFEVRRPQSSSTRSCNSGCLFSAVRELGFVA